MHYIVFGKKSTNGEICEISHWLTLEKAQWHYDECRADGFEYWIEDTTGKIIVGKKPVETINIAPTWEMMLPVLLALYCDGNADGRATAFEELRRMARIADTYVAEKKVDNPEQSH